MTRQPMLRRRVMQGGLGFATLGGTPLWRSALAADEGDAIVAAAVGRHAAHHRVVVCRLTGGCLDVDRIGRDVLDLIEELRPLIGVVRACLA